ncbi:hypothetical protein [Christiangramia portivictoriae]|uniref:hypothetical protein n=1 Tax=Christiangramia portivictoriae TaxID=326069 RepID=UPI000400CA6A|nr:hypothetical protein [Christiangramia portivictoriae]
MPNYTRTKVEDSFILQNLPWTLKLKNRFGKIEIFEYKLHHNQKEYILISKECFHDVTYSSKHLETFLQDFKNCDWKNQEAVKSFLELFKEINPKLFPKFYITHKYTHADEALRKAYKSAVEWAEGAEDIMIFDDKNKNDISDNEFFMDDLNEMIELLKAIREHDSKLHRQAEERELVMQENRINDSVAKINDIKSKYNI